MDTVVQWHLGTTFLEKYADIEENDDIPGPVAIRMLIRSCSKEVGRGPSLELISQDKFLRPLMGDCPITVWKIFWPW